MPSITIEQYIQHYNDQDYINKLAIFILDVDYILNRHYEDSILPYISSDMPKMACWINDYLDKSSLRLRNNCIVSREYSYDIQVKKMNGEYFLNMKDIGDGKRLNSFYSQISQNFLHNRLQTSVEDCDIIQALKRIYIANLYIENQKVQRKYSELHKNLEFMKKFMRDCFTK